MHITNGIETTDINKFWQSLNEEREGTTRADVYVEICKK